MENLEYKSILATEKGWLFASSRMFVKGDSNMRASGGVSEKQITELQCCPFKALMRVTGD